MMLQKTSASSDEGRLYPLIDVPPLPQEKVEEKSSVLNMAGKISEGPRYALQELLSKKESIRNRINENFEKNYRVFGEILATVFADAIGQESIFCLDNPYRSSEDRIFHLFLSVTGDYAVRKPIADLYRSFFKTKVDALPAPFEEWYNGPSIGIITSFSKQFESVYTKTDYISPNACLNREYSYSNQLIDMTYLDPLVERLGLVVRNKIEMIFKAYQERPEGKGLHFTVFWRVDKRICVKLGVKKVDLLA